MVDESDIGSVGGGFDTVCEFQVFVGGKADAAGMVMGDDDSGGAVDDTLFHDFSAEDGGAVHGTGDAVVSEEVVMVMELV